MKKLITIFFSLVILGGCSVEPRNESYGTVTVKFPGNSRSLINSITTYTLNVKSESGTYNIDKTAEPGQSITIVELKPDSYIITVKGFDSENNEIVTGLTTVLVEAGKETPAKIQLSYSVGGISVEILLPEDNDEPVVDYIYEPEIRVNQIGYGVESKKVAIVANTKETTFEIINNEGLIVFSGHLSKQVKCDLSGDYVRYADFTSLKSNGEYKLKVNGIGESYSFSISDGLFEDVFKAVLKSYYYQRCSFELEREFAGTWVRSAGHLDENCTFHSTTGKTGEISSTGGWYDAGDYGKYIVNGGITVWTLLALYELYPDLIGDNLNIPESGDGFSDLLNEVWFELSWMSTMQDSDGGVFFKLGPINWPGEVMPENDNTQRYVIGKSTTSTLNFAAVFAQAARVYKPFNDEIYQFFIEPAEKAWQWALTNNNVPNPPTDIPGTGPYDDKNYSDEFLLAASELLIATNKTEYKSYIEANIGEVIVKGKAWWQDLKNLSYFSLMQNESSISDNLKSEISNAVISYADKLVEKHNKSTLKAPMVKDDFTWGSYSNLANYLMILIYAYEESNNNKYKEVVFESLDYFFGKNPTGYTAVTGFGDNPPMNLHHRPSGADGIVDPVPGLVISGSNKNQEDKEFVTYTYNEPAKSYMDVYGSWASNENAINQNASLFFVLGFINKYQ